MTSTKNFKLVCLAGDGIGPEIMDQTLRVVNLISEHSTLKIETQPEAFGGASIDLYGSPLTDKVLQSCQQADAVLLAAVGGAKWDNLSQSQRPEGGLLKIRKELGLYCNLRPARVFSQLQEASPLKTEVISNTDLLVVRELTGGLYFGEPRGLNENEGWNTARYNREEVVRVARRAFELARQRRKKVTSVDKANVLEASQFWRKIVLEVHKDYSDVQLDHLYVDNAAMQLVRAPSRFDVLLTSNLFGDILSDLAGMLTGSLGMLPSASLGDRYALYEPIHGSAPDIAGQNKANPFGMIGSLAMCLELSCKRPDLSQAVWKAVELTLNAGHRTADIATKEQKTVGTKEITDIFLTQLKSVLK
ncbi:MAG: 3-isopropylmalate dehydrogenase [Pseudobdellovibrionaceae bacterium]